MRHIDATYGIIVVEDFNMKSVMGQAHRHSAKIESYVNDTYSF